MASNNTILEVLSVLRRHLDKETMLKILADLKEVDGNESFRMTIRRMHENVSRNLIP